MQREAKRIRAGTVIRRREAPIVAVSFYEFACYITVLSVVFFCVPGDSSLSTCDTPFLQLRCFYSPYSSCSTITLPCFNRVFPRYRPSRGFQDFMTKTNACVIFPSNLFSRPFSHFVKFPWGTVSYCVDYGVRIVNFFLCQLCLCCVYSFMSLCGLSEMNFFSSSPFLTLSYSLLDLTRTHSTRFDLLCVYPCVYVCMYGCM